jgi:TolB-like protein/DNA-binding winged helix-turn-helix (wHTH) protein/Tfp pilus assembly protein PilF
MPHPNEPTKVLRLGVFELDFRAGELRRQGLKIRLQEQPLQVLMLLLEHPGEVVTREELQKRLWPADTFVDFDHGLNKAINKLREALNDDAEKPRFIETLPRRGYRYIAPIATIAPAPAVPLPQHTESPTAAPETPVTSSPAAADDETGTRSGILVTPPGREPRMLWSWRNAGIAAALIAVLAAGSWWWVIRQKPSASPVIAVLPFKNLSPQPGSDYFSDGLTDEIIRNLSIIDGLQVKSSTSSFAFKNKPRNIREVGALMGVNLVLEGSVLRDGEKLRIDADLVRVSDDSPLWSGRFDRELKDVFAIQDEISRSIVNELRLKLGGQRRYNTNPEAYDLYLKAKALANFAPAGHKPELLKAIELFEQVIAKDPNFAPAYAGIANVCAVLSGQPRESFEGAYDKGKAAAQKAMQLDPLLAEAYGDMGLFYARGLAWNDAERSFRRALQLNPNLSLVRIQFAIYALLPLGKLDEAVQQVRKAVELDPLSPDSLTGLAFVLTSTGHDDESLDVSRRLLAIRPDDMFARMIYGRALMHKLNLDEAIGVFEKLDASSHGFLGYAYAKAGRRAEAEKLAAENDPAALRHQVLIYAGLGDKDRTLDALERMAPLKDPVVDFYPYYPELALLRGDHRLNEFRRKRGLPPIQ